jgi:DNA-binding NtrC family response regulator
MCGNCATRQTDWCWACRKAGTPAARRIPLTNRPLRERMERYERAVIADTLARTGGAVSQAADLLQVGKATLYDKIKRYGL